PRSRFITTAPHVVAFSPDGKLMAAGDANGKLSLYESPGWNLRWQVQNQPDGFLPVEVGPLAFSADGKTLAEVSFVGVNRKGGVRLWDTATGRSSPPVPDSEDVSGLQYVATGKTMILLGEGDEFRVLENATGELRLRFASELQSMFTFSLTPDGQCLIALT